MDNTLTWFDRTARRHFERFLLPAAGAPLDALQIGVFRGDASVWLLENVLTHPDSTLTDVDTWEGSAGEEAHEQYDWSEVEAEYRARMEPFTPRVGIYHGTANTFFAGGDELDVCFVTNTGGRSAFDFVYVDGSHRGLDVLQDGLNAWNHLKPGGIIAFDDYMWGKDRAAHLRPHDAIDAFLAVLGNQATLMYRGQQVWISNTPADPDRVVPGTVGVGFCSGATTITTEFRHCYTRLLNCDARETRRITAEHTKVVGGTSIPAARNEIVEQFLVTTPKAEWLWFVDTDATFAPSLLEELLAAAHPTERPIMGGLSFRINYETPNAVRAAPFKMEPMLYARINDTHFPVVRYPRDAIIKVNGLPTHCLLIHRSVLEDPRWREDGHHHPWFRMSTMGGKEMSEDLFFCWKAEELGYPIHANTRAKTGHEKHLVFDEDLYFRMYPQVLEPGSAMQIQTRSQE